MISQAFLRKSFFYTMLDFQCVTSLIKSFSCYLPICKFWSQLFNIMLHISRVVKDHFAANFEERLFLILFEFLHHKDWKKPVTQFLNPYRGYFWIDWGKWSKVPSVGKKLKFAKDGHIVYHWNANFMLINNFVRTYI